MYYVTICTHYIRRTLDELLGFVVKTFLVLSDLGLVLVVRILH